MSQNRKVKPDMALKCAKHTPLKQAYTHKSDKTRIPTHKQPSSAKIKSKMKPEYKHNPNQISIATQQQSNKAENTTNSILKKNMNYPIGEKHIQTKQENNYKQHQVPFATLKQSN